MNSDKMAEQSLADLIDEADFLAAKSGRPPSKVVRHSGDVGRPPAGTIGHFGDVVRLPARAIEHFGDVVRPPARVYRPTRGVGITAAWAR